MVIGIDVDGVLRDFETQVKRVYKRVYPDHKVKPFTEWRIAKAFPIGDEIYDFVWKKHPFQCLAEAPSYLGALGFVAALKAIGISICIVTVQPTPAAKAATWEWLARNDFLKYADHIVMLGDSFVFDKSHIRVDILLDDYVGNLNKAGQVGIRPVCFDRPWNRTWVGERVKDYWEFVELINMEVGHDSS